ncbi:ZF-HD homeobox protein [Apostasia shenzhenica]|uniref:ZF-HD homeobox protein n=1 Tax=Apostasia shenzhenica TaxID=1088818 RepID=A0A2I0B2L7_9ASPA|nr:ZF-HD homeobox protein [Apostasia shenzhenica]
MEFREDDGFARASAFSKPSSSSRNGLALSPRPLPPPQQLPTADPDPFPMSVTSSPTAAAGDFSFAYRECLRNHAASVGGHVVDGCCEFMPSNGDSYKCAACGCHRSFHRKDSDAGGAPPPPRGCRRRVPLLLQPPTAVAAAFSHYAHYQRPFGANSSLSGGTSTESSSEERVDAGGLKAVNPSPTTSSLSRKRFRTKFTPEQKAKMTGFAERVGWRLQRQDDAAIGEFCNEVGVRRQVFKVWMHNNKHAMRKQQQQHQQQQQQQQVLLLQQQPHEQLELHERPENYP